MEDDLRFVVLGSVWPCDLQGRWAMLFAADAPLRVSIKDTAKAGR
jgi:hypothetical protein